MVSRRKILRIIPAVLLAVALALSLSCARASGSGQLTLVNRTDEAIARAEVLVCDQSIVFEDIPPGDGRTEHFEVRGDSGYRVEVIYASGEEVAQEVGYVTSGVDTSLTIEVAETGISVGAVEFQ